MKLRNKLIPLASVIIVPTTIAPIITACGNKQQIKTQLSIKCLSELNLTKKQTMSSSESFKFRISNGELLHYTKLECYISNLKYSESLKNVTLKNSCEWKDIEDGLFTFNVDWSATWAESTSTFGTIEFDIHVKYDDSIYILDDTTFKAELNINKYGA